MFFFVYIDSIAFEIKSGISVMQACELANIIIPRFCYHQRLSIAGNCRMCLVKIDKMPKLQVSCAIPIADNMVISTKNPLVLKAREGILEFLLINHPLDCPICDQGGECDLQEHSLFFGGDKNRFKEFKRATEDKYCGPLIKTIMTRCIHCTRCIRFVNEIVGMPDFGTVGRANSLSISFYTDKLFVSELSGNVVDLCPVGALTSKPYAFLYRPWELKNVESVDIFDSIHSNIKIEVKGYEIIRILPRLNELINDEWISDKARYAFDGFFSLRLVNPILKNHQGVFEPVSWKVALGIVHQKIDFSLCQKFININVGFVAGSSCDFQSLVFLKKLSYLFNVNIMNNDCYFWLNSDFHDLFRLNTSFNNMQKSNLCLILGLNPKTDGVLLNYHLRKRYLQGKFKVAYFGSHMNLMFPSIHLGCSINKLVSLLEGSHYFCQYLRKSLNPIIIVGKMFLNKLRYLNSNVFLNILLSNLNLLNHSWNVFNFFNLNSKDYCYNDLCMNYNYSLISNKLDILFIVEEFKSLSIFAYSEFTVFLGHHGCFNAQKSDLILPTTSHVEKNALYGNCQGRYQYSRAALLPFGYSKDSSILLFDFMLGINESVFYLTDLVLCIWNADKRSPSFVETFNSYLNFLLPSFHYSLYLVFQSFFSYPPPLDGFVFLSNSYISSSPFDNFYQTDIVCQSSLNMLKSSVELLDKVPFKL